MPPSVHRNQRRVLLGSPRREDWTPQSAYRAVASRLRWENRMEMLCREIMSAGRYLNDRRRRKPVPLLDREQYDALATSNAALWGMMSLPEAEAEAARLTTPLLYAAATYLEQHWQYRRSESKWAGGEHSVMVVIGDHQRANCTTDKVWSDNKKWSGTNSSCTVTTDLPTIMEFPTLTVAGLMLCRARKVGVREYEVRWLEQSVGVQLREVDGWLIRGYHVVAKSLEQARRLAAAARQRALSAAITARQAAQQKRISLQSMRAMWLDTDDSIAAGNCQSATVQFAQSVWQRIGASGPCAVRADVVLAVRDDLYTRRAVGAALHRQAVAQ